ncbi:MAG TPA: NADH-quinone oxidoreductase subunit L [Thermoanaerobaculia bacterium]|nr:NADH-quinone oxidoreductase subunit L [Thermoanaerobaculia bacterium]
MLDSLGLIPLIPFIGFLINGIIGRKAKRPFVTFVALLATATTAVISTIAVIQYTARYHHGERHLDVVYNWFTSGGIGADIAFQLDPLSIVMLMVVTWIGFLIHLYSVGYMAHEEGYARYFAYLNLFLAAMLILILGSNYLFVFVGWEGVGLCSYLLIGFYYEKDSAASAGKKAFVVNRIGDFGFLIAMFLMFAAFGSLDFETVSKGALAGGVSHGAITAICLLLFVGACGKSAQIPLYVWLPDAMAGPTPVSALIHAATMVTAGVYMVVRSNVLFRMSPTAMLVVALVGTATAIFAATIGLAQNDIKKVLAYSTVSQLGFMFMAAGVGAFTAAIFHVVTHAFFKACLFLGSGSVIHAMGGEQDIRKMGALRKSIPVTFWTFLIATLAIAGFPPLAGFFSKDEILASALTTPYFPQLGKVIWAVGTLAAFFTAFYMFRLLYLVFFGKFRGTHEQEHHLHESPSTMTIPLIVLAILSAVGGFIGLPRIGGRFDAHWLEKWLHPLFPEVENAHGVLELAAGPEVTVMVISTIVAIVGWMLARRLYATDGVAADERMQARLPGLFRTLSNKYYVDEAYDSMIVRTLHRLSMFFWKIVDAIIDGTLSFAAYVIAGIGDLMRFLQTGNVRNYALMLFGGVVIFLWVYV